MAGMGMNNCIAVDCRKDGSMDPEALDAAITKAKSEGKTPFFVSSTAGTTVLGAYGEAKLLTQPASSCHTA